MTDSHKPRQDKDTRRLLAVFAVALAARLVFVAAWPTVGVGGERALFPDEEEYLAISRHLVEGEGFRDDRSRRASRAPGYPLFVAGLYSVAGRSHAAVKGAQALLGAGACVLAALLARRLFRPPAGAVCGWIAALYPFLIAYTEFLLAEALFTLLLVAGTLLLVHPWRSTVRGGPAPEDGGAWPRAALAGLALGAGVLVRSSLLLYPLFAGVVWVAAARRRLRAAGLAAVVAACVFAAQVPWIVRNHRVFGEFVPTTLQVGESLYEAVGPGADGTPRMDRIDWIEEAGGKVMGEHENNAYFRRKAMEWARAHPARTAGLAFVKLGRFWNVVPNAEEYRSPLVVAASLATYVPVMAAALLGMAVSRKRWRMLALPLTPALYYSCLHMVFVGSIRYRTPVMPMLMAFSACGALWLIRRLRRTEPPGTPQAKEVTAT